MKKGLWDINRRTTKIMTMPAAQIDIRTAALPLENLLYSIAFSFSAFLTISRPSLPAIEITSSNLHPAVPDHISPKGSVLPS